MMRNIYLVTRNGSYGGNIVPVRFCSQKIRTIKSQDVSALRRGTGGRSSFNGNVITVFGATGFLGRSICNELGKRGSQLIIPYRSEPDDYSVKKLKVAGDLGQVLFQPFDLRDPLSIRKAIKYSNIVINLIGVFYDTKSFDMYSVNVEGAAEIAKACRELNVERLIHFSSLNVTENPERYVLKRSKFFPTKLKGEQAVLEEFPEATIFRPGSVCGVGDRFLWPLISFRRWVYRPSLYAKGCLTTKMPVYSQDVAQAVAAAIEDYDSRGMIYQAIGPQRFLLRDILLFCLEICQHREDMKNFIWNIKYDLLFFLRLFFHNEIEGVFKVKPRFGLNLDRLEIESTSDVVDNNLKTLVDLGITLSRFEDYVPSLIVQKFNRYRIVPYEIYQLKVAESISRKEIKFIN